MVRKSCIVMSSVLALLALAGCAKSTNESRSAARAREGLMPAAEPQAEFAFVSDQRPVKVLSVRDISYDDYESFAQSPGADASAAEVVASGSVPARIPGGMNGAGGGRKGQAWWQKVAGRLAGGGEMPPSAGDMGMDDDDDDDDDADDDDDDDDEDYDDDADEEDDDDDDADDDDDDDADDDDDDDAKPAPAALQDARPALARVPAKPGSRPGMRFEAEKTAALAVAKRTLIQAIWAYQVNPATTVGDLTEADASAAGLNLPSMQMVAAKWRDNETLEVEVQVRVGDVLVELQGKFGQADFSPLKAVDQNKCFAAKGAGRAGDAGPKPAGPGSRADRASRGI